MLAYIVEYCFSDGGIHRLAWAIPNPLAEGVQVNVSATATFILIATSIILPLIGQAIAPNQES
jgi:hypothetical protein